tara:strand:- start:341 stop:562 length:222 start_codon:yes stop_codon:yes gene_type:complete
MDHYKYHNVSLRNEIFSEIEDLSNRVVKGRKLSNPETVQIAIKNLKTKVIKNLNGSKDKTQKGTIDVKDKQKA